MKKSIKRKQIVQKIFASIADRYDAANDRISLGFQKRWKGMLLRELKRKLRAGDRLLDVCCGTGDICLDAAEKLPGLITVGLDITPEMLAKAKEKRSRKKLSQTMLIEGDAASIPFEDACFAAASISFGLRNTGDYRKVLSEMVRVTKHGGWILCLDSFVPQSRIVRPFYKLYFKHIMPLLGGGRKYRKEYRWLYSSTEAFLTPDELACLFRSAGCRNIHIKKRMFGACVLITGQVVKRKTNDISVIEGGNHECR